MEFHILCDRNYRNFSITRSAPGLQYTLLHLPCYHMIIKLPCRCIQRIILLTNLTFLNLLDIVKHPTVVKYCLSTRRRGLTARLQTRPDGLVCNLAVNPLHLDDKHYIYRTFDLYPKCLISQYINT